MEKYMELFGMIGIITSLVLLIYLTLKGINIIIGAILSSILLAVTSGLNLQTAMMENYMDGFTGYFASWFLVFLLRAIFGKVMQETKRSEERRVGKECRDRWGRSNNTE